MLKISVISRPVHMKQKLSHIQYLHFGHILTKPVICARSAIIKMFKTGDNIKKQDCSEMKEISFNMNFPSVVAFLK